MKKIFFSAIFLVFSFVNGYAQTEFTVSELKRLSIDLSAGPSIPFGDFAAKSTSNMRSGFAKAGEFFEIRGTYIVWKYFGFTASYRMQAYKVDHDAYYVALRPTVPSAYASMKLETGTWKSGSLLVGPCFRIPFNAKKRTFFEAHYLFGEGILFTPKIESTVAAQGSGQYSIYQSRESINIAGLTTQSGCSFRRMVTPNISLNAGVDFVTAIYKKDDVRVLQSDGSYQTFNATQPVQTFNVSFGVSYLFL